MKHLLCFSTVWLAINFAMVCRAATESLVVTQAVQLRNLSVSEASKEIPVRLRGVVTFHDSTRAATFIHDGSDGTFVWVKTEDLPKESLTAGTFL